MQQKADVAARFKEFKVDRYARGIMWIMKDTLGLDEGFLIVEPSERIGRTILRETVGTHLFVTVCASGALG